LKLGVYIQKSQCTEIKLYTESEQTVVIRMFLGLKNTIKFKITQITQ